MLIHATGFVNDQSGSVASANAVLLNQLLLRHHQVRFYSKPSFVDPRTSIADQSALQQLTLVDCTNTFADRLRASVAPRGKGPHGWLLGRLDAFTYHQKIHRELSLSDAAGVDLWLGDWAKSRSNRPVVSYVQGPPCTDAQSVFDNRERIVSLIGKLRWLRLAVYAYYRTNFGLPNFRISDRIIVGSEWSRQNLNESFGVPRDKIDVLPYPVDLVKFQPKAKCRSVSGPLKVLWVGRFAPRKRLDLFLDGLKLAIENGQNVNACVVGNSAFVANYEKLIENFEYPQRLEYIRYVRRDELPDVYWNSDVLAQASESENFGSSVAEALAMGIPAITGRTNGTSDYVCPRSIVLQQYSAKDFAEALSKLCAAKVDGLLADPGPSRQVAERAFSPETITDSLEEILASVLR